MPREVKLIITKDEQMLWKVELPKGGFIARDKNLPTCLRKAATKLSKLRA